MAGHNGCGRRSAVQRPDLRARSNADVQAAQLAEEKRLAGEKKLRDALHRSGTLFMLKQNVTTIELMPSRQIALIKIPSSVRGMFSPGTPLLYLGIVRLESRDPGKMGDIAARRPHYLFFVPGDTRRYAILDPCGLIEPA